MSVDPQLRTLDIDIPTPPESLVKLSLLLAEDDVNLSAMTSLIEREMSLAAAVLKAVNSSLYGLKGRVQSVQQALTYLGLREIAAITFEFGLRAAFQPVPELEPVWKRAANRGLLMGRMGQQLSVDPWGSHSAGLFEECGKAVLFKHAPDHYRAMWRAANSDLELVQLEHTGFGVSHDALGAALCESWGLAPGAVASVRHHVHANVSGELPEQVPRRTVCALSAVAYTLMNEPDALEERVNKVAPQAQLDPELVLRAARRAADQLTEAERQAQTQEQ